VLPIVGDKKTHISLSRGVVLSQSTFHLVHSIIVLGCGLTTYNKDLMMMKMMMMMMAK